MKKINKNDVINIDDEVSAIFDFTKTRWNGLDDEELKQILDLSLSILFLSTNSISTRFFCFI